MAIPWPNGYGAEKTIELLVGMAPTIFVVGRDGRIVWNDDRARFRHDVAHLGERLEEAIQRALNDS